MTGIAKSGANVNSITWCSTTENSCEPTTIVDGTTASTIISTESDKNIVCAYATDSVNHSGNTICSDQYKLDKTGPIFNGLNNIYIGKNGTFDLDNGVSVTDELSGTDGSFAYPTQNIDTTQDNAYNYTYTATDYAGNTTSTNRRVSIDATPPQLSVVYRYDYEKGTDYRKSKTVRVQLTDTTGIDIGIKTTYKYKWSTTPVTSCDESGMHSTVFSGTYDDNNIYDDVDTFNYYNNSSGPGKLYACTLYSYSDHVGNVLEPTIASVDVYLDNTPPRIVSVETDGPNRTMWVTYADDHSGVWEYAATGFDGVSIGVPRATYTAKFVYGIYDSGEKQIFGKDTLGNILRSAETYYMDVKKPTIEVSVKNAKTYEQTKTATIKLKDNHELKSGSYTIYYDWKDTYNTPSCSSLSNSKYINVPAGQKEVSFDITLSNNNGDGELFACAHLEVKDTANNSIDNTVVSDDAYMDNEKPTITYKEQIGNSGSTRSVIFRLTDNIGLKSYAITDSINPPSDSSYDWKNTSSTSTDLTVSVAGGKHYIHVRDQAYNKQTLEFYVDTTLPTIEFSVTDATKYTNTKTGTITISDDAGLKSDRITFYYGYSNS